MTYNKQFVPDTPSPLNNINHKRDPSKVRYDQAKLLGIPSSFESSSDEFSEVESVESPNTSRTPSETHITPPFVDLKNRHLLIDDDFNYNNKIDDDIQTADNSFMTQNLDLANFPLFRKAPKSFYNKVISHLKLVTYHPQSYIIKKGDDAKSMYWILKGTVSVTSSDGESIYSELSSGQFFGEIGILFNRPRTANVIAKTKVLVGVLTSKDFNIVLRSFPLMERRIRDEAQERIAMLDKKTNQTDSESTLFPVPNTDEALARDKVDATVSINQFIKSLPIFQNLPSNIFHKLCLGVEPLSFSPFQYIFYENDIGADIYFIVSGQVEVVKFNSDNTEQPIARLNSGSYFGEMCFLSWITKKPNFKRSASIRSITNVELIVIRSNLLKDLCNEYPFLMDHMRFTSEFRNNENQHLANFKVEEDERVEFKNFEFKFDFKPFHSRSVSPVAPNDDKVERKLEPEKKEKVKEKVKEKPKPHVLTPVSIRPKRPHVKRSISLNLTPSLNSPISANSFVASQPDIDYIPLNKRLKFNQANLRRRSSILSHNSVFSDTILLRVFEFLDLPTLMKLRLINRRWRQLLYLSPNLFKVLDLTPWNTTIDDKSLIEIIKFVGSRPQHIDISNCFHITDVGFSYMANEIGISGKIKSLKMSSNWEVSAMAIMDLAVPSVGKNLEEIDLSNCRKVRDNVIERLIGWEGKYPNENGNVDIDDDFDDGIGCKKLTKINLGYCKHLTDRAMYHISENCNERIQELDLTRCTTITDKGFEYWTYKFFPSMKKLSLKDCTFLTDKSIISIANSLPNLENLNLNFCCSLTDISIEVLCIGCQNLKFLDLSFCGSAVSDSSLLTVSLSLKNLQTLILKGCIRVTRAGIDSLLSSDSALTYLDISQCKNSNVYPGSIPAQKFNINTETKSAFVTAGDSDKIIEIVT